MFLRTDAFLLSPTGALNVHLKTHGSVLEAASLASRFFCPVPSCSRHTSPYGRLAQLKVCFFYCVLDNTALPTCSFERTRSFRPTFVFSVVFSMKLTNGFSREYPNVSIVADTCKPTTTTVDHCFLIQTVLQKNSSSNFVPWPDLVFPCVLIIQLAFPWDFLSILLLVARVLPTLIVTSRRTPSFVLCVTVRSTGAASTHQSSTSVSDVERLLGSTANAVVMNHGVGYSLHVLVAKPLHRVRDAQST